MFFPRQSNLIIHLLIYNHNANKCIKSQHISACCFKRYDIHHVLPFAKGEQSTEESIFSSFRDSMNDKPLTNASSGTNIWRAKKEKAEIKSVTVKSLLAVYKGITGEYWPTLNYSPSLVPIMLNGGQFSAVMPERNT